MPKRSNDFQKLIYQIYNQLAPAGATVTESAMVQSNTSSSLNEVDILIEQDIAGHKICIAIECRDRSRKDDKTWVNDLIGKYIDLPVNKVIAVSRSGFSEGAIEKAKQHNIETLSFKEATKVDWQKEFIKIGVGLVARKDTPISVQINFDPSIEPTSFNSVLLKNNVFNENDVIVDILEDFLYKSYLETVQKSITNYSIVNFKTIIDRDKKLQDPFETDTKVDFNPGYSIKIAAQRHLILNAIFKMKSEIIFDEKPINHYSFGEKTIVSVSKSSLGENLNLVVIQHKK